MLDAGIIDQDVQFTELGLRGQDHGGDLVRLGHVGPVVQDLYAVLLGQFGASPLDGGHFAEAVQDDVDALGRERVGEGMTDPAGRARHNGNLPLQTEIHGHAARSLMIRPCRCCNATYSPLRRRASFYKFIDR